MVVEVVPVGADGVSFNLSLPFHLTLLASIGECPSECQPGTPAEVAVPVRSSGRLWKPFDKTFEAIESFNLENGVCPTLPDSDTKEFSRLNTALNRLMTGNMKSYRTQKEFTENASHELQTPLAVFRSKLDILLQQPDLTENQAVIVQDLYQMTDRLSHLNRNLLLLAKMENSQFSREDSFDVVAVLNELLPCLENLAPGLTVRKDIQVSKLCLKANKSLFESLVNNLIVNAVRHNRPDGEIRVTMTSDSLSVSNTSNEPALDPATIFTRFNHRLVIIGLVSLPVRKLNLTPIMV